MVKRLFLENNFTYTPLGCFLNWHLHLSEYREILSLCMFTFILFFLYYKKQSTGVRWHTPMEITLNAHIFTSTPIYLSDFFPPGEVRLVLILSPNSKTFLQGGKRCQLGLRIPLWLLTVADQWTPMPSPAFAFPQEALWSQLVHPNPQFLFQCHPSCKFT